MAKKRTPSTDDYSGQRRIQGHQANDNTTKLQSQHASQKNERYEPAQLQRPSKPRPDAESYVQRKPRTSHLQVTINGRQATALVDTGADYKVLNGPFAARLKKVTTAWDGSLIRTAGGHLIPP